MKNIKLWGIVGLISSSITQAKAQTPLFAGYTGKEYALELRIDQNTAITAVGKTSRKEVPLWAYLGTKIEDEIDEPFYGVGLSANISRLHTLPTIEGYGTSLTGVSLYCTTSLPKELYMDIIPRLEKDLSYKQIEVTLHGEYKNTSIGLTTDSDKLQSEDYENITWRVARFTNPGFIAADVNFKTDQLRISAQINTE